MWVNKILRNLLRILIIVLWAAVFYLQFERPFVTRFAQNISPSFLLSSLPYAIYGVFWISLPLLIFAIIKGRAFCRNLCPIGLLQDVLPSPGTPKHSRINPVRGRPPRFFSGTATTALGRSASNGVNLYIFLGLLVASFFGTNILAVFDPFVTFNRVIILFTLQVDMALTFITPLVLIILLNIYKKRFWCFRLCPLGAFFDWITLLKSKKVVDLDKRKTLAALGAGLFAGIILKNNIATPYHSDKRLLRPPGALPEDEFQDRCIRCGSCTSVCITKTLSPVFLASGLGGIFTPRLVPETAECDEYCNKCGQACPTSAIQNLPLTEKRNIKIGTADVDQSICLAWSKDALCLICQEYCPYLAIEKVKNKNGNPSPRVIPDLCRGCGHCENHCPVRTVKAIKVYNFRAGETVRTGNRINTDTHR